LTKLKRWRFVVDSQVPKAKLKAKGDIKDLTTTLSWLAKRQLRIDFSGYPEKPKNDFLPGLFKLYSRKEHSEVRDLLKKTLDEGDIELVEKQENMPEEEDVCHGYCDVPIIVPFNLSVGQICLGLVILCEKILARIFGCRI
jgi:hypothetical protein